MKIKANEAALWVLRGEDFFVILENRIIKGSIYMENEFTPVIRVGGSFYHIKYENGEPKADYTSPIVVDNELNIIEE